MTILLTRPLEDSKELANILSAYNSIIFPLMDICFYDISITPNDYDALLITSANGLRALGRLDIVSTMFNLPVFTVGDASKKEADKMGFKQVFSADGDVKSLAKLVVTSELWSKSKIRLLHMSGADSVGDLGSVLNAYNSNFVVDRIVAYKAIKTEEFTPQVIENLINGTINSIMLYSPRSARIFVSLINRLCERSCERNVQTLKLIFFCLSPAVKDVLSMHLTRVVRAKYCVAKKPTQDSLLEELKKLEYL